MKQSFILKQLTLIFFFCLSAVLVFAQGGPGDPGGGPVGAIPVDGGLAFLLAAGVGYGAKKVWDGRKSRK